MQVGSTGRAPDLTLVRPRAFGLTYPSMHAPLYFNGRYTTTAERVIGVEDRGFQFGDGLYEVIKYTRRHPLLVTEHLQRLAGGLAALEIASPMSEAEWAVEAGEGEEPRVARLVGAAKLPGARNRAPVRTAGAARTLAARLRRPTMPR